MAEVIYKFQKNTVETIQASITEFNGKKYADLRIYYTDDNNELQPTKKGLTVSVESFPEIKKAVNELEKALKKKKLIT